MGVEEVQGELFPGLQGRRWEQEVGLRRCVNPAPAPSAWLLLFALRAWAVSTQYLVPGLRLFRTVVLKLESFIISA